MSRTYVNNLASTAADFPGAVFTPFDVRDEDLNGYGTLTETGDVPASPHRVQLSQAVLAQTALTITVDGSARTAVPLGTTLTALTAGIDLDTGLVEFYSADETLGYSIVYTGKGSAISADIINKMQKEIVAVETELYGASYIESITNPSVDNTVVRFNGTAGNSVQGSLVSITDAGQVVLPSGSASAPSLCFTGASTNTGLYLLAADSIGFSIDGTTKGSWSSTGLSLDTIAVSTFSTTSASLYGTLTAPRDSGAGYTGAITLSTNDWSDRSGYLTFTSKGTNPTTYTHRVYGDANGKLLLDKGSTTGADVVMGSLYFGPTNSPVQVIDSSKNATLNTVKNGAGTVTAPSYTFSADTAKGFYSSGTNQVAVACSGVQKMNWAPTYISFSQQLLSELSYSLSAPQYSFSGDANTGFARVAADTVATICGGQIANKSTTGAFEVFADGGSTPTHTLSTGDGATTNSGSLACGPITVNGNPDVDAYPSISLVDNGGDGGTVSLYYMGINEELRIDKNVVITGGLSASSSINGTDGNFSGYLTGMKDISIDSTVSVSLNSAQTRDRVIVASGQASLATRSLPTAVTGLTVTVANMHSNGVKVQANTGDVIRIGTSATVAAGYVKTTNVGGSVTLTALDNTVWLATSYVGAWTIDS